MKQGIKYIVIALIMVVEIYGITLLGYFYSVNVESATLRFLLIISCVIAFISSIIFTQILRDRSKSMEIEQKWQKCPYFIEKYDDLDNPEYIDRSIE